jgi:uncharacterized heparinase superfamily protein
LRDLRAVASDVARQRARDLVADWLACRDRWDPIGWRPDVVGARIAAWIQHLEWITAGADPSFRKRLLNALARQARHLRHSVGRAPAGHPRIAALRGLVAAGWCLDLGRATRAIRATALARLAAEIETQVHPDGGHLSRSPAVLVRVLRDLVDIRAILRAASAECPAEVQTAIDRMGPCLRFFRHGDDGLALFNDSNEEEAWRLDDLLIRAESLGRAPSVAPHVGFQRMAAGQTLVLVDAGAPADPDGHAHAGTLAFEMSVGKLRMIVNCGAHAADGSDWRRAQRATAAHSTLSIDHHSSSEPLGPCGIHGNTLGRRVRKVAAERMEGEGQTWLELAHDGYVNAFGREHRRRLWLSADGEELRGEDMLVAVGDPKRGVGHRYAVRFHLHFKVQALMTQDGRAVLLKLANGFGWRLRTIGGEVALHDSIYLGRPGEMKKSQQIVMTGTIEEESALLRWSLRREGTPR